MKNPSDAKASLRSDTGEGARHNIKMEFYNGILCISGSELIRTVDNLLGVMSRDCYNKLGQRGKLNVVRRGCNSTPALIEFDSIPTKYREMILQVHSDPRVEAATAPFIKRIVTDTKAQDAYMNYEYDGGKRLPLNVVERYTAEASIYNTLHQVVCDMTLARKHSPTGTSGIWDYALSCINSVREYYATRCGLKLPGNVVTLKRKYKKYNAEGYSALIHSGFGNANRNIIKTEVGEALLLTLMRIHSGHDMEAVTLTYNEWAEGAGEPQISARMARDFYSKNEERIMLHRQGKAAYNNKYDQVIRRNRPSAPLMLINADDNDLDLFFRREVRAKGADGKIKTHKTHYYRPKIYVVMDAHCDYLLGYAVGNEITKELIKEAFRNAMNHVKQITGNYHLWGQIVADRWGIGVGENKTELHQYFENQALFTPPAAGLARSKTIERAFGREWHRILKLYPNYAGHNITAKTKHNKEWLDANKNNFPDVAQVGSMVEEFIDNIRSQEWKKSGKSRKEIWLMNFNAMSVSAERQISDQTYLSKFGQTHPRQVTLTNQGLKITINGDTRHYDIPAEIYRQVVGKKVDVIYDPADLSRVMATDDKGLRFVATPNQAMPQAAADMKDGDRARLDETLKIKKLRKLENEDEAARHLALLQQMGIRPDDLLQAGLLGKRDRFAAQQFGSMPVQKDSKSIYDYM